MLVLLPLPILFFPDGRISRLVALDARAYIALMAVLVGHLTITDLGAFTDRAVRIDSSGELKQLGTSSGGDPGFAVVVLLFLGISLSWVVRQVVLYRRSERRPAPAVEVAPGRRLVRGRSASSSRSRSARATTEPSR